MKQLLPLTENYTIFLRIACHLMRVKRPQPKSATVEQRYKKAFARDLRGVGSEGDVTGACEGNLSAP